LLPLSSIWFANWQGKTIAIGGPVIGLLNNKPTISQGKQAECIKAQPTSSVCRGSAQTGVFS
jgi:hypothetical protein